jgi:hemerythrin-like domain-containing protein
MNLAIEPPLVDDSVERLFAHHRKAERHLAALGRLPIHLELHGVDAEASAIASTALQTFGTAMAVHHDHEERDLLPLLEQRIGAAQEAAHFRALRTRIQADHRELARAWRELRRPLLAISEGLRREVPPQALGYFRVMSALHISAEEGAVHPLVHRYLRPGDREALAQRLRRAATKSSST